MNDTVYTDNYYTIGHLIQITGLTDRTIRSYLSQGFLEGEKINGLWHFTPQQVESFLRHPAVRPSILSRANGIVYDHLSVPEKDWDRCCMILDITGDDKRSIAEYFCYTISKGDYHSLQFSFDGVGSVSRVILRGPTQEILSLVQGYHNTCK